MILLENGRFEFSTSARWTRSRRRIESMPDDGQTVTAELQRLRLRVSETYVTALDRLWNIVLSTCHQRPVRATGNFGQTRTRPPCLEIRSKARASNMVRMGRWVGHIGGSSLVLEDRAGFGRGDTTFCRVRIQASSRRHLVGSATTPRVSGGLAPLWDSRRASVNSERNARMSILTSVARALQPVTNRLSTLSPVWIQQSQAPLPHYAIIDCLITAIGWPNMNLTTDLICGAPCVGDIPDSGVFREAYQTASNSFPDVSHDVWNRNVVDTLSRSNQTQHQKAENAALWDRTQKEVADGFAKPIGNISISEVNREPSIRDRCLALLHTVRCRPRRQIATM
jgi:hypothetical protein